MDLNAVFAEIERELRTQYLIAYSSTNKKRDGAYRKITVEITNPALKKQKIEIRHRPGYYAKQQNQRKDPRRACNLILHLLIGINVIRG